MNYLDVVDYIA